VRDQLTLLEKAGFESVEFIDRSGFKTSPHTEGALFQAVKPH
jgi:hypothetical protein